MADLLIVLAALAVMAFALRWKREDTLQALGEEAADVLRAEIRRNARSQLVRVLGLAAIGAAGISYGPRAFVQYQQWQVANVGHTVTRFSDIATASAVTVLFQCDWDGAPRDDAADCKGDGYVGYPEDWTVENDAAHDTGLVVVDATDAGLSASWPNDRALLVVCGDRNDAGPWPGGCASKTLRNSAEWANPSVGDVYAYRTALTEASVMLTDNQDDSVGVGDHGYAPTPSGGSNASVYLGQPAYSSIDSFRYRTTPLNTGFPGNEWCPTLNPATADCNTNTGTGQGLIWWPGGFEFEWHTKYTFHSDTSYSMDVRVYDIVGDSLLLDYTDFVDKQNNALVPTDTFYVSSSAPWNWDYHTLGTSAFPGYEVNDKENIAMRYYGGVAVCKNNPENGGFCPRYGSLPGETPASEFVTFFSDFGSGTGAVDSSAYAVMDSALTPAWNAIRGLNHAHVIDGDSANALGLPDTLPGALVIKHRNPDSNSGPTMDTASVLSTPGVGESLYVRMYLKNTEDSTYINAGGDVSIHPAQSGEGGTAAGVTVWEAFVETANDGTWSWLLGTDVTANPFTPCNTCDVWELATARNTPVTLYRDSVYVFELEVARTDTDSVRMHARAGVVTSSVGAGTVDWRWGDSDFISQGPASGWLSAGYSETEKTLADSIKYELLDPVQLTGIQFGSNGWGAGGESALPTDALVWGGFAVKIAATGSGWIGAYPAPGEPGGTN